MSTASSLGGRNETSANASRPSPLGRIRALGEWIAGLANAAAAYYSAAWLYERLSRLSNAELHRRGLTRDALAEHVREAAEQSRLGRRKLD